MAEMTVINPFDFFVEESAETLPVRLRAGPGQGADPLPRDRAGRARGSRALVEELRQSDVPDGRLPGRDQPAAQPARSVPDPDGAGGPDVRGDADARQRVVPRLGLAAGADPPAPGPGGAVRLGLPDPAQARRQGRSMGRPGRRTTSPTCTPGPRCTCRARAGSASIRPRACSPAKGTSRWPARPIR